MTEMNMMNISISIHTDALIYNDMTLVPSLRIPLSCCTLKLSYTNKDYPQF